MASDAPASEAGAAPRGPRSWRRTSVRVGLSVLVFALGLELALRALLFGGGVLARIGAPLRRANLYADQAEELWWTLSGTFDEAAVRELSSPGFDPVLGWRGPEFDPKTYRHHDEDRLGARRPVLLYGASYAACYGQRANCWNVRLEHSDLGARFAMLDYGVSSYGLDQIWLLFEHTIDLYAARDPLVLVSFLIDDDLDRVGHRVRSLPKPWFELEAGELVFHEPPAASLDDFVRAHPPEVASYAWRRLLHSALVPERWCRALTGVDVREQRNAEICRALLERFESELERRGLTHVFVLFHGRASVTQEPFGWEEPLVLDELARLGAPYVSTRTELRLDMRQNGREPLDYFFSEGKSRMHYNALAMEVVFGTLRRAIEGRYDGPEARAQR